MNTQTSSTPIELTADAINAAIALVGQHEAPPTLRGQLGGCVVCGRTVASHFDRTNRFLGCLNATDDTVFILVGVTRKQAESRRQSTVTHPQRVSHDRTDGAGTGAYTTEPPVAVVARGAKTFRYRSALHHKAKVERLGLAPTQRELLTVLHTPKGRKEGMTEREILKRAKGLNHGSFSSTNRWLRDHGFVLAEPITD